MPRSTGNCFRRYNATKPAVRHTTTNSQEAEKPQQPKSNHRAKVDPPNTASNGVLEGIAQKIPIHHTTDLLAYTRSQSPNQPSTKHAEGAAPKFPHEAGDSEPTGTHPAESSTVSVYAPPEKAGTASRKKKRRESCGSEQEGKARRRKDFGVKNR